MDAYSFGSLICCYTENLPPLYLVIITVEVTNDKQINTNHHLLMNNEDNRNIPKWREMKFQISKKQEERNVNI